MKFCLVDFRNARPKLGASNKKREQIMRSGFRVAAALGSLLVLGGASDMRPPGTTVYGNAPIGHLQPHNPKFSPASAADQIEQEKMSQFNAEQRKLDEELDRKLNICSRC